MGYLTGYLRFYTCVLLYLKCSAISDNYFAQHDEDIGFELMYTSNPTSVKNHPLKFDNAVPRWIKGVLIRNGLGVFEMGQSSFLHILDSYAKLLKIEFTGNNTAYFSTQVLQTQSYMKSTTLNKIVPYLTVGGRKPAPSLAEKIEALVNQVDNTNINVYQFMSCNNASKMDFAAVSDYWHLYIFNEHLEKAERIDPVVPGSPFISNYFPLISSGHPMKEYGRQTFVNILSVVNPLPFGKSYLHLVRIHSTTKRENIVVIPCDQISYMHSFGMTKRFAILFADPLFVDFNKALEHVELLKSLNWKANLPTKIHIVNIITKTYITLKTVSGFHLHHINSYEQNTTIICDFVVYADISFMTHLKIDILKNATTRNQMPQNSQIIRYKINTETKTVKRMTLKRSHLEFTNRLDFPVINEKFRYEKYCYIYGIVMKMDNKIFANVAIVKKDICQGKDLFWYRKSHYPSEPTFVASPNGEYEDSGVIMAIISDGVLKKSYVLILNATNFVEISKSYFPVFVPALVHGRFFS